MIPFSPPRMDQKIIDEVIDTLQSGWITTGPKTKKFEQRITAFCNCKKTLAVNSATSGLEIVLRWFGVGPGDEVILPAYTYSATANVVWHCGAKPVFVDVNADDFNIDVDKIKKAITSKTKVIMPVDFAGYPCDYTEINQLVRQSDIVNLFVGNTDVQKTLGRILVLSDAAHSFGAQCNQKMTGTLTDVSVFSFHAVKNLTTAEGGAIAFNLPTPFDHDEIYAYLNTLILHGQNKDALAKTQKGNWEYDIIEAGYKANMTDILASIGLVELERYSEDTLVKRKEIFDFYRDTFARYPWAELPEYDQKGKISSYHIFALRIKNITLEQRNLIISKIFDKEVSVNVHFKPVPMMSFYRSQGYDINNYPVAKDLFEREISLPVFYDLSAAQMQMVTNAVIESVNEVL